jgi:hypothetical protein
VTTFKVFVETFDNKKNLRALNPESDLDQVLTTNLKIFEMVKLFESNSKINTLRQPRGGGSDGRVFTCDGAVARGGGARGGALSTRADPEQSYLWCVKKGHTIFDCPSPSTPALKKVRDDLLAKHVAKGRNETRKTRRLASAAASAIVSDDESDITEGEEIALTQDTFASFQALFATNETSKSSCFRVLSQDPVDSSLASSLLSAPRRKVERCVSITDDQQICPVPSRCRLPAFVTTAQALRLQTSYNKHHKSSFLDVMELKFGCCRRSGNTPATQLPRLLQLGSYYAYEEYYDVLRDASVLTIRALKDQPRTTVLDTGATCSASNNPAETELYF